MHLHLTHLEMTCRVYPDMLPAGIRCTPRINWRCSLAVERAMLLPMVSRERPFRARDLAFADAMEDRVEFLNGLQR